MNRLLLIFALWLLLPVSALAWEPDPGNTEQQAVADTVDAFITAKPELADWFDEAYAWAVFPRVINGAALIGGAWGRGLIIEQGKAASRVSMLIADLGVQAGAQSYQHVILFRDAAALEAFRAGLLEFRGRASAVAFKAGASADPAYSPSVAQFSLVRGGLMIQASAGAVRFGHRPLKTQP